MGRNHQLIILSFIAIVLLMFLSKCNSYPLFNDLPVPERPGKLQSQNDVDRYVNRMKQYYETMAQLRHWRRDIDESNEDYDGALEAMLQQDKNLEYKR